jgi:DNA-binding response OmpR family regulator
MRLLLVEDNTALREPLAQSLREAGRVVPVLVLTARDRWHEKVEGIDAGADDPGRGRCGIRRRSGIRASAGVSRPLPQPNSTMRTGAG